MTGPLPRSRVGGKLGALLVRSLFATVRCVREGEGGLDDLRREGRPVVFAFWHGQLLPLLHYHRDDEVVTLVSQHRDGEFLAQVLATAGIGAVRGSSTRGGVTGLRDLARRAREGHDVAITPDGPQGPWRRLKPGALTLARLTGHPVIPVAAGIDRAWRLGSWDRFLVPKPFSTVRIVYGEPIYVPRRSGGDSTVELETRLEGELNRLSLHVGDGP